jgi:hypothetical protein
MMVVRKHAGNTDPVHLQHLRRLRADEIPTEFLNAIAADGLNVLLPHACSMECQAEAERQFVKPVVEYRTNSIPEIQTR